ncbi:MAG: hypothetical protein ABSD42_06130 [Candidatus Bathyarchaeia archaeon]|jgi:hypothetical protein
MFRDREQTRRRLKEIIEKFRQKGATSPEKAMTIQELDLPPRFEQAMHRRLGQSGIFVETNGKYYLNEERLKRIEEQRAKMGSGSGGGGGWNRGGPPSWFRIVGILLMLPLGIILAFVLFYFLAYKGSEYFSGEFLVLLLVIVLVLFVVRMLFWRSRRRYWQQQWQN